MPRYSLFLLLILLPMTLPGQEAYFSTDSTTTSGVKLIDRSDLLNSQVCEVDENGVIKKYSPYELKEYGFKDGRIYRSYPVRLFDDETRYFFERVTKGKVEIFYLKARGGIEKYYIEETKGSGLIEIPPEEAGYKAFLTNYVKDCPYSLNNIKYLSLNRNRLQRFFSDYEDCPDKPFPRLSWGFFTGISASLPFAAEKESIYSLPDYKYDINPVIGAYVDLPVYPGNLSFHPELQFSSNSISASCERSTFMYDFVINYSFLMMPVLIRYNFLHKGISPFFEAGPVYSIALRNKCTTYTYDLNDNNILLSISDDPLFNNNRAGFSAGTGAVYKYGSDHAFFGELRYNALFNLSAQDKFLNVSEISLIVGIQF